MGPEAFISMQALAGSEWRIRTAWAGGARVQRIVGCRGDDHCAKCEGHVHAACAAGTAHRAGTA